VLTNGRVPACMHRVRTPSGRERFLALMSTLPAVDKGAVVIRPLDKLVDGAHPRLYRPVNFEEYARFKYSDEGRELGNRTLEAFCGVKEGGDGEEPKTTAAA
jgi:isopenicillin N synthase-like dioxygenase